MHSIPCKRREFRAIGRGVMLRTRPPCCMCYLFSCGRLSTGNDMDDIKQTLDKLREELTNAGKRLADLAERGQKELPHAAKRINEEYERLQGLLDAAVDKLRRR